MDNVNWERKLGIGIGEIRDRLEDILSGNNVKKQFIIIQVTKKSCKLSHKLLTLISNLRADSFALNKPVVRVSGASVCLFLSRLINFNNDGMCFQVLIY